MRITKFCLLAATLLTITPPLAAQDPVEVHGAYTYIIGHDDDVTLRDATRRSIELAKAEAIKAAFGEMVTSDVIDSNAETDGKTSSSYFWENTVARAKGEWLGDTQPPAVSISQNGSRLHFHAEVWGKAREIVQADIDLSWSVLKNAEGRVSETSEFRSGERINVAFQTPADGFVAIYLITGDDETACLLPYKNNGTGRQPVTHGKKYTFFDKDNDPMATHYRLSTKRSSEDNQLVLIYSPKPFAKCNDITGDKRHPNSLSTHDFQKWLLNCQRNDHDMVVKKKWVKITNTTF